MTLVLDVLSEVYGRHPALTELALDAVATLKGRVQAGDGIGHDPTSRLLRSKLPEPAPRTRT